MYAITSRNACTESLPSCNSRIEEKLDLLIRMVSELDDIRGFGSNVLANVVGDILMRKR